MRLRPPSERPGVNHHAKAPEGERELTELVAACVESWEQGIGPDFRDRNNRFFAQYRGFRKWRDAWLQAGPRDKDGLLWDAKNTWGSQLHIPLSYRTIETMVPAAIAQRPQMLLLPREPRWEENVTAFKLLLDAQQEQIDIDLPFQAQMRAGRIYGIGFGKSYWRKHYVSRRRVKQRTIAGKLLNGDYFEPSFTVGRMEQECIFDDPIYEDIDVFDCFWDPMGSDLLPWSSNRCSWFVHRIWLSLDGCLDRVASGAWNTEGARALSEEDLRAMGSASKYDEIWMDRMTASGFPSSHLGIRGEQLHELWEWHDGERVLSVLDRSVLVQDAESPCCGLLPFTAYRPTPLQKQMVGIGDLEPLEHLQRELDTLRSQRRDAATLALCAGYAYDSGAIDEEDLVFGPAAAIEVRNARPSDALMPLQIKEPPGTSYQEEQVIRTDFDAVSGVNDALNPQPGASVGTATEAQLVQAALSRRVELGSRRFEIEAVRQGGRCFVRLDQRMILSQRKPLKVPEEGLGREQALAEGRWKWYEIGPGELQGDFEFLSEGGSMAARNVQQDRMDAVQLMQLFGQNPHIEPRRPLMRALKLFGEKDPEAWLRQAEPPVPPLALKALEDMGVDPQVIQIAVQSAQQQDPQLGPDQAQVDQSMGQMPAEGVAA